MSVWNVWLWLFLDSLSRDTSTQLMMIVSYCAVVSDECLECVVVIVTWQFVSWHNNAADDDCESLCCSYWRVFGMCGCDCYLTVCLVTQQRSCYSRIMFYSWWLQSAVRSDWVCLAMSSCFMLTIHTPISMAACGPGRAGQGEAVIIGPV